VLREGRKTSRRQAQIPQQTFDFGFAGYAHLKRAHKHLSGELLGVGMSGAMQVFNNLGLSSDESPAMIEALFGSLYFFSNGFLTHQSLTRWDPRK
jgi:hypothetical protein